MSICMCVTHCDGFFENKKKIFFIFFSGHFHGCTYEIHSKLILSYLIRHELDKLMMRE